jgi:uncharacterized protein YmfQ (DUF2313 family)
MFDAQDIDTVHSMRTPHGMNTPHKMPEKTVNFREIMGLTDDLYPTGRAWTMNENSIFRKFHEAINRSFFGLSQDAYSLIDSSIPDNIRFTEEDCSFWEHYLGIYYIDGLTVNERRNNIKLKMSYPAGIVPRQSRIFIEDQLRKHGFDVRVYENIFYEGGEVVYKRPDEIGSVFADPTQHSDNIQHGGSIQHGAGGFDVIANTIQEENFVTGDYSTLWATFYISGSDISTPATIPQARKNEFRELVLKLKPAHLVAFLFINYN